VLNTEPDMDGFFSSAGWAGAEAVTGQRRIIGRMDLILRRFSG